MEIETLNDGGRDYGIAADIAPEGNEIFHRFLPAHTVGTRFKRKIDREFLEKIKR